MGNQYLTYLEKIAKEDVASLHEAEKSYKDSWKKRGGVGAFMMLARKWDRLENQVKAKAYDVFLAILEDPDPDAGILDDLRDLRCYLLLVEAEMAYQMEYRGNAGASEHEMMERILAAPHNLQVGDEPAYFVHDKPCVGCEDCTGKFIRRDDVTNPSGYIYLAKKRPNG